MTLLQALTEANTDAGINKFAFANIKEFQSFMDSFGFATYPVNVIVPPVFNGSRTGGRNKVTVNLQGWVLRRIPEDTNDFRSEEVEALYLQPMRDKAIKFINALLNIGAGAVAAEQDFIDPEVENVAWTVRPEYMFLPAHLFGVGYTVNLPIVESVC